MRKKYVKPMAFVEGFELSSHIATCVWDFNNNTDPEACFAEYNDDKLGGNINITIFNIGVEGCLTYDTPTVSEGASQCYFVGADPEQGQGITTLHNS